MNKNNTTRSQNQKQEKKYEFLRGFDSSLISFPQNAPYTLTHVWNRFCETITHPRGWLKFKRYLNKLLSKRERKLWKSIEIRTCYLLAILFSHCQLMTGALIDYKNNSSLTIQQLLTELNQCLMKAGQRFITKSQLYDDIERLTKMGIISKLVVNSKQSWVQTVLKLERHFFKLIGYDYRKIEKQQEQMIRRSIQNEDFDRMTGMLCRYPKVQQFFHRLFKFAAYIKDSLFSLSKSQQSIFVYQHDPNVRDNALKEMRDKLGSCDPPLSVII